METLIALDGLEFGIHFSIFEIGDSGIGCLLCEHPPFDPWLGQPISNEPYLSKIVRRL